MIRAHRDIRAPRQCREPLQFCRAHHFVRDQHVVHAAIHHGLGFADFLTAHADGAESDLAQRDFGAFVAFGVRAHFHVAPGKRIVQQLEVVLESIEVEYERGGIDIGERHADLSGRVVGHCFNVGC